MPHEYKSGETVDGLQEGPVVHGISSGACGTVRHLAINASGVVESYLSSATTSNVYISNATIEQTTGAAHNTKNIAVAGMDGSGNVQPPFVGATNREFKVQIVDPTGAEMDLFKKGDNFAVGSDHGLMILALSDGTPNKYYPMHIDATNVDGEAVSADPEALEVNANGKMFNGTTWDRVRGDTTAGLWAQIKAALPAGTNNIGSVTVGSGSNLIGSVTVNALPTRATANVGVTFSGDALMNNTTALTPKFAAFSASGSTNILSSVADKRLRVINYAFTAGGATAIKWQGDGTALTGSMPVAAGGGFAPGEAIYGHFEAASGTTLNIVMSSATQVGGYLVYVEV